MKIAHFGDLHIQDGPRGEDAVLCVTSGLNQANVDQADLIVFAGDLFDHKSTPISRNHLAIILQKAANLAPVYAVYGNHDRPGDLDIFRELKARYPITIADRPTIIPGNESLPTAFLLPYPTKAHLHAHHDLTMPEADLDAASSLRDLLSTWGAEVRDLDGPCLFIGHLNVAGSRASTGQPLIGRELEVAPGDLLDLGCTYYALGHIHKRQSFAPNCWYAGSISRQDFGEMEDKGWNLVTIAFDPGKVADARYSATVEFRPVPARPMVHVETEWTESVFTICTNALCICDPAPDGADVRFRYTVSEELAGQVDESLAREWFDNAHSLKIERIVTRSDRVRSEDMAAATTLEDKIQAYWNATEAPDVDQGIRVLDNASHLAGADPETVLENLV